MTKQHKENIVKETLRKVKSMFTEKWEYLYFTLNNRQGKGKDYYTGYNDALEDIKVKFLSNLNKLEQVCSSDEDASAKATLEEGASPSLSIRK